MTKTIWGQASHQSLSFSSCKSFVSAVIHFSWALIGSGPGTCWALKSPGADQISQESQIRIQSCLQGEEIHGEQMLGNNIRLSTTKSCGSLNKYRRSPGCVLVPGNMRSRQQKKIPLTWTLHSRLNKLLIYNMSS